MADQTSAADLPDGSVVAGDRTTYVKDHPTSTAPWRGTRGGHHGNWEVDKALADGAQVLRVGANQPITLAPDARERLARHLWLDDAGSGNANANLWDRHGVDRTTWLDKADAILAVITGKES